MVTMSLGVLCICIVFLIVRPISDETPIVLFFGVCFLVFGSLIALNGLSAQTVVRISDELVEYRQRIGLLAILGMIRYGKFRSADILSIYYEKKVNKWGWRKSEEQFRLYVYTAQDHRVLLLKNVYDEDVVVAIKDEIILKNKLAWTSELG